MKGSRRGKVDEVAGAVVAVTVAVGSAEVVRWQADPDRRERQRSRTGSGAAACLLSDRSTRLVESAACRSRSAVNRQPSAQEAATLGSAVGGSL
jgi:hypothetical protein